VCRYHNAYTITRCTCCSNNCTYRSRKNSKYFHIRAFVLYTYEYKKCENDISILCANLMRREVLYFFFLIFFFIHTNIHANTRRACFRLKTMFISWVLFAYSGSFFALNGHGQCSAGKLTRNS